MDKVALPHKGYLGAPEAIKTTMAAVSYPGKVKA